MASSMEVQPTTSKESETVLASSGSSGSVSVALHPLVIMNISEHYTRIKAQYGEPNPQGDLFLRHGRRTEYKIVSRRNCCAANTQLMVDIDLKLIKVDKFRSGIEKANVPRVNFRSNEQ